MTLKAKIIESNLELKKYENDWAQMYLDGIYDVFQSFHWFDNCCKYIHPESEIFCIMCYENQNLVAIAPFHIVTSKNEKVLTFAGGNLTDYNTILIKKGAVINEVCKLILETLNQNIGLKFNMIRLNHIRDNQYEFENCFGVNSDLKLSEIEQELAMAIELPESVEAFNQLLQKKYLSKIHYYKRRLLRNTNIHFQMLFQHNTLDDYIAWFSYHKKNLWDRFKVNIPQEMREGSYFSFLKKILEVKLASEEVLLPVIKEDEKILASGIYFKKNQTLFKYIQSWDYDLKSYNIGTILDWHMIQYGLNNGYKIFDLGRGAEEYKYKFSAKEIKLKNYFLSCAHIAKPKET